ncbi:hypothetical protein C0J52_28134 [Blattella germanica]|nr:hypothetical protein C0J52_28134 [Blattella germanica]
MEKSAHKAEDSECSKGPSLSEVINATAMDHSYSAVPHQGNDRLTEDQTEQLMTKGHQLEEDKVPDGQVNNRYKNLIMRRYLTDLKTCQDISPPLSPQEPAADVQAQKHKMKRNRRPENHLVELTKWLESAAKFKPGTRSQTTENTGRRENTKEKNLMLLKH